MYKCEAQNRERHNLEISRAEWHWGRLASEYSSNDVVYCIYLEVVNLVINSLLDKYALHPFSCI